MIRCVNRMGCIHIWFCCRLVDQIKKALDIYGVHTTHSVWLGYDEELGGAQVDLILDRDENK